MALKSVIKYPVLKENATYSFSLMNGSQRQKRTIVFNSPSGSLDVEKLEKLERAQKTAGSSLHVELRLGGMSIHAWLPTWQTHRMGGYWCMFMFECVWGLSERSHFSLNVRKIWRRKKLRKSRLMHPILFIFFFFCAFSTQAKALAGGPQLHVTVKTQASWKPADSFLTATR